ncbi:uncharacterized protein LOC129355475 isoform X2 [Poeciliopsis prolifica]|uniref:uncharacterized protein LOC129355475 isoform X2 n=1 Tax=Poeciliopsis prolifica TaxID=188132 RepID=UPI0024142E5E|nr:uncharacterized protein LOC129355475 isoform X2 [Poeciliopsis prolifica]
MGRFNLSFILLLPFTFCSYDKDYREPVVKTIGKEADWTPVCSNSTQKPIVFMACRIRPVRSREEECHLVYRLQTGFVQGCDSRFSLMLINQTIFLYLNNLTAENSGNYSCLCSGHGGTIILQLNITVEDEKVTISPSETTFSTTLISLFGVCGLIIIILLGVISGCICWNKCHRRRRRREVTITPHPNTEVQDIEPYSVYRENELYLTSVIHTSLSTNNLIVIGMDNPASGRPL